MITVRRIGFAPDSVTGVRLSLGQNFRANFKLEHAGHAALRRHRARDVGYAEQPDLAVAPRRADGHLRHRTPSTADAESQLHRLPDAHAAGHAGAERRTLGRRSEQSLQQHPDRRRERERHLRTRHHRPARRAGARPLDLARRRAGVSGAALAVRRAPGKFHRRADQRGDEERHERAPRVGLLLLPQSGSRGRCAAPARERFPAEAVRLLGRRSDREGQDPLLRRARVAERSVSGAGAIPGLGRDCRRRQPMPATVQRMADILKNTYGLDAGAAGAVSNNNPLTNVFARLDFVLPYNSRLVLRDNYGKAELDTLFRTSTSFRFGSNAYSFNNKKNAAVAQLFTNWNNGANNELFLGYTTIRDNRPPDAGYPVDHGEHRHHGDADCGGRGELAGERARSGHLRDHRQLHDSDRREAPAEHRHAQRVLQDGQSVRAQFGGCVHVRESRLARGGKSERVHDRPRISGRASTRSSTRRTTRCMRKISGTSTIASTSCTAFDSTCRRSARARRRIRSSTASTDATRTSFPPGTCSSRLASASTGT